ncbi:hypothetical protein HK101_001111 [Irineochytrium annulatum]|nr:hypothetical protein HK101_001111 [Irineochytrium annulatum]
MFHLLSQGGWLFTDYFPPEAAQPFDSNGQFNARLGYRAGGFQIAESVPLKDENNAANLNNWDDGTDAFIFLTVYADQGKNGFDAATPEALTEMAYRVANLTASGRSPVFLRYCPEMNGSWMVYGVQPQAFVKNWRTMAGIVRAIAPEAILVWSPNFDIPAGNDYWPGAEYVDWVGASSYWKGFGKDELAPSTYVGDATQHVYTTFAQAYNKPFVISEASGAWETGKGVSVSTTQDELQYSFWATILNSDYLNSHPLFRGAFIFEFAKQEEYFRDFRVTHDPATLKGFQSLIAPLDAQGRIKWANLGAPVPKTSTVVTTTSTMMTSATALASVTASVTGEAVGVTQASAPMTTMTTSKSGAEAVVVGLGWGGFAMIGVNTLAAGLLALGAWF